MSMDRTMSATTTRTPRKPSTPVVAPDTVQPDHNAHVQDWATRPVDCPVSHNPAAQLPTLTDTAVLPYTPVVNPVVVNPVPDTDSYTDDDNRAPVVTPQDMAAALMAPDPTATVKPSTGRGCGVAVKPVKRADSPVPTTTYVTGAVVPLGKGNDGAHGVARAKDLPWCDKKAAVLSALSSMGATSIGTCQPTKLVALTAGVNDVCARHYCYHAAAAGLTGVVTQAFGRQQGFYVTADGLAALASYLGLSVAS